MSRDKPVRCAHYTESTQYTLNYSQQWHKNPPCYTALPDTVRAAQHTAATALLEDGSGFINVQVFICGS